MARPVTNPAESDPNAAQDDGARSQNQQATEEQQVREAQSLDAKSTYEVIRREGEKELERSTDALFWSGLAAGLSMGFSFLTEGIVIVIMTWLIAAGRFAHVIAGSSEVFYAAWRGEASWADALAGFVLPSLIGNMVGGITLVAALNHAQATSGE
jgi:formate/nitrite transporter FocA (FNT family)